MGAGEVFPRRGYVVMLAAGWLALTSAGALADDHHDDRDARRDNHGRQQHRMPMRQPYRGDYEYGRPIYAPPPVYYPPQPESGISLFLPFNLHR